MTIWQIYAIIFIESSNLKIKYVCEKKGKVMRRILGLVYLALGAYAAWELGKFAESHKGIVSDTPVTLQEHIEFFAPFAGTLLMSFLLIAGLVLLFKKSKPQPEQTAQEPRPQETEQPPQGSSKN